jgi:hypothetical protein
LQNVKITSKIYWDIFMLVTEESITQHLGGRKADDVKKFNEAFERMKKWN